MKNTIRNLIVGTGILVLLTHTVSAQWVQIDSNRFLGSTHMCLAASGNNLFAGTEHGVFRFTNNGTSWTAVDSGLTNTWVNCLVVSGSNIFAGGYGGVFLATNNGTSWTAVNSGLMSNNVCALAVSGGNLFAGGGVYYIFRSIDNGTSWTEADSGINVDYSSSIGSYIFSLAASGNNIFAARTYTSTYSGGVYHSSNNGATWTPVNSGLPAFNNWRLAASGNNIFAGGMSGIYRSSNNGATWTAVNSGLPESTWVMSFAVSGSNIFAGTSHDVFLSTDSGTSWAGCSYTGWSADGLAVGESYIFASFTEETRHWIRRRPLSEIVGIINGKPQQGIVKPYAGGFKINISKNSIIILLPENLNNGAITVELFTVAGKRIYSATHQAYNGTLNIPVSGLSTGTYLMSIRGNNTTLSSPFVVTK